MVYLESFEIRLYFFKKNKKTAIVQDFFLFLQSLLDSSWWMDFHHAVG